MANLLCDVLLQHINASCHIEFHWGKDKTLIGHTSIVIKFDRIPLFTIDFGPIEGAVRNNWFGSNDSQKVHRCMLCSSYRKQCLPKWFSAF